MNEKERVKRCIGFDRTEKPPWQIGYTSELAERVMKKLHIEEEDSPVLKYRRLDDFFGNHMASLRARAFDSIRETEPGIFRDEWGVLWDRRVDRDIGTPAGHMLEDMNLDRLVFPNPNDEKRFIHFPPIIEANPNRYLLVKVSYTLFERAWSLRGMENLLMDFILNPGFVRELFSMITDFNLLLIDSLKQYPVDGIIFGDDWGWQGGLLMHPDTWRKFILPCIERTYERAHLYGFDVFIHSCGDITAILDDLLEVGVDVFNPFQPEVMDIEAVMKKYAGKLAFYGGVSIQKILPFGTPEEVRREIEKLKRLSEKYGGYIISPSHDMPKDIPLENILAMREVLMEQ